MKRPPKRSPSESASTLSDGQAFTCSTFRPSLTGVMHARTAGWSPTCTRQLGQRPEQHKRPRGRWYLNEREKTRLPAANSAEAIVSPSCASTGLPSKLKLMTLARWISSPSASGRRVTR